MDFPTRRRGRRARPATESASLRIEHAEESLPADGPEAEPVPATAAAPRKKRNETLMRVLFAIPAAAAAIAVIVAGGLVFAGAMAALAIVGAGELFRMLPAVRPAAPVAFSAVTAMVLAAYFGDSFHMVLAGVAFFPVMYVVVAARGATTGATLSMAVTVFAIVWIGVPFAHAVLLRELPVHGAALLVDVLVATFATDTFAYFGGRLFGSHKLAPTVSPNKTVEGLVIGIFGGMMAFWFAGLYQDWLPGLDALVMGLVVACIAPIGDLFSSLIKRDLEVKDTGTLFGPHGGLLDRLDAVLFTVVAGYYLAVAYGF